MFTFGERGTARTTMQSEAFVHIAVLSHPGRVDRAEVSHGC